MQTPSLLKFQIGPVQDFIAQARSTRDLWSGSYLLSWLVAAGIKALPAGCELVFPNRDNQPLLEENLNPNAEGILIPNLPNIFIAKVSGDATKAAGEVAEAVEAEWQKIANHVWAERGKFGLPDFVEGRYRAQVARHLSIAWMATQLPDDHPETYREAYRYNGWHLDAVRQLRDFRAWDSALGADSKPLMADKDSLSGREEALVGGNEFKDARKAQQTDKEYGKLFKHADYLGAVALIKRVWHIAYLQKTKELPSGHGQHFIRSIPAIAAGELTRDEDDETGNLGGADKYIAAIAFDGDSIGAWVNGDKSPELTNLRDHHKTFSANLSAFSKGVREIVEVQSDRSNQKSAPLGQLIYAGGDDVVCLVPADAALAVATALRTSFVKAMKGTATKEGELPPDASAGIAIAHIHSPLQDLIREAQKAEKRAKTEVGRPAFSITLMKRSGEISHWGSKWDDGDMANEKNPCGIALYQEIAKLMTDGKLSTKFPHRVCQLLSPYLTRQTDLSKQDDSISDVSTIRDLISREFSFAAERQGSQAVAETLRTLLMRYLEHLSTASQAGKKTLTQKLLTSIIGLCTTVAFAQRNCSSLSENPTAEKQPSLA